MSTRFNKLPPKPEYIATVKAALERGDESSIRDISREPCYSRVPGRRSNWLPISNPIKLLHYGFVPTGGILNGVPVP